MNKFRIIGLISKEGRKNIKEVKERLDQILEITQCIECKEKKPLSEFSEDENGNLGFSNICKECFDKIDKTHKLRKCSKCGEFKEYNDFYILRREGYFEYCMDCTKKMINQKSLSGHTKQCFICGEVKLASTKYFDVSVTSYDYLKRICKLCCNKRKRESKRKKRNKNAI